MKKHTSATRLKSKENRPTKLPEPTPLSESPGLIDLLIVQGPFNPIENWQTNTSSNLTQMLNLKNIKEMNEFAGTAFIKQPKHAFKGAKPV
jgi:hypothetical protein